LRRAQISEETQRTTAPFAITLQTVHSPGAIRTLR
jgi:hypothetical protein